MCRPAPRRAWHIRKIARLVQPPVSPACVDFDGGVQGLFEILGPGQLARAICTFTVWDAAVLARVGLRLI